MTQDLVVGNLVVPGVVAALVVAAWELLSARALKGLEARLARQGEAYRLAQSPRVEAAVELWAAVCELERAVTDLVTPFHPLDLGDEADGEERREAARDHRALAWRAVRRAHRREVAARARAECLLPAEVHAVVDRLRRGVEDASDRFYQAYADALDAGEHEALKAEALAGLERARGHREAAVVALRSVIDPIARG
ncbi:MAG: hypothetical protein NDI82_02420 [Anaeromyxobacteraceae bacterium]|nr:hypothetical protein [Anaeromyxobacteraceae bacterium]